MTAIESLIAVKAQVLAATIHRLLRR
uniref:Uncharacterized protein n=1 Tax=Arundo donax TaxID=35708 RepID=A0A0A8ZB39_ARUDO